MSCLNSSKPEYDQIEFDGFLKRKEQIRKQKEKRKEKVQKEAKKELLDKIVEIQRQYEDMGKEADSKDIIDCIMNGI